MVDVVPVDITPQQNNMPETPQVDMSAPDFNVPSPEVAQDRANKATMGIGPLVGKGFQDIYSDIAGGQESTLRSDAAGRLNAQNAQTRHAKLMQLTSLMSGGVNVPDQAFKSLVDPTSMYNRPIDPESVIERGYGSAVMSSLEDSATKMNSPAWKNSTTNLPTHVDEMKERGSLLAAQNAYLDTQRQNVQDKIKNDSWFNYGLEFAKENIPGVSLVHEMNLRGLDGKSVFEGLGLGTDLNITAQNLYRLPFDQFKSKVDDIVKGLNPYQADQFLSAIQGQSTYDKIMNNVGTLTNVAMGAGLVGKAATTVRDLTTVESAVKNTIKAARMPNADKAALANAAGDADTAAVHTASKVQIDIINNKYDPLADAKNDLTSNFNTDLANLEANPGRFGNAIAQRIRTRTETVVRDLFGRLENGLKVDEIPEMKASPEVIEAVKNDIKKDYVGVDNALLDVVGPHWDQFTNTNWFEHRLGNYDGTLFATPEQAASFAHDNGLVVNKSFAPELQKRLADLTEQLREPPAMDADVNELNRSDKLEKAYQETKDQLANLERTSSGGYLIKDEGLGFYISKWTPMNVQSSVMNEALAQTQFDKIFQEGWAKTAAGWLRTPEEVLSKTENDQRHIATFGPQSLIEGLKDASKEIQKLPRKYWSDWKRTIDYARKSYDEEGRIGSFFKNGQDLDDFYLRNFDRLPEEKEVEAYFAFKRNYEFDRVMREVQEFKYRARLGAEQHQFTITSKDGRPLKSKFIDAIKQREFPHGDDTIAVIRNGKIEKIYDGAGKIATKTRQELEEAVAKGELGVLRVYNPEMRELNGFGSIRNQRVRYVITDSFESKPLQFNHVERRGGGHFAWDYDFYIKQAKIAAEKIGKIVRHYYEGDQTIMPMAIQKMGKDVVEHLNKVRELIRDNKLQEAEDYNNTKLNIPWDKHINWYKTGRLDPNEPIHLVSKNKSILDMDNSIYDRYMYTDAKGARKTSLIDGTRSGSDARQYQVDYVNPRDVETLHTINDVGGRHNPLYQYEPAQMVDPITTMNRGLTRIVNSSYMNDMKLYAIRHWLKEAEDLLDVRPGEVQNNPFGNYMHPRWKTGADPIRKLNLLSARQKQLQFIGTPSSVDTYLQRVSQSMVDSVYGKLGPKAAILSNKALAYTKDPLAFMRTVAFHTKLGMFNVPQFFTQLMTASNILGIAGYKPFAGATMGQYFHYLAGFNPSEEILNHLDELATRMHLPGAYRFRPGEWKEAYQFIKNSGFQILGHENALLDTPHDSPFGPQVVKSDFNRFLDWGETFFRLGAQNTRIAAAYTAYLEHRVENIGTSLSRMDNEKILSRASLLDHNMNRSANSVLHTGIMAAPGQFAAYGLRLAEMMTGKRLTTAEKARLFTTSSILYGIPLGGIGLYGFPIADYLRQKAKEQGYIVGDRFLSSLAMEGAPATLMALITGSVKNAQEGGDVTNFDKDWVKGDWYNFSKWGPESYQLLEKANDGETPLWKLFGGASVGTVADMWRLTSPVRYWASTLIHDPENAYPLQLDDILQGARVVSSFNHYWQTKAALNTGRWVSQSDTYLSDVDKFSAVLQGVTGLQPTNVSDITLDRAMKNERDEGYKQIENEIMLQERRALQAYAEGSDTQGDAYHKAAMSLAKQLPLEMRTQASARVIRENQPLIDRLAQDYFLKKVPPHMLEKFMNTYSRYKELQDQK